MNLATSPGRCAENELVAPARAGGSLCTRTFIPHDCHSAVGVLGAVTVATAAVLDGSVARAVSVVPRDWSS